MYNINWIVLINSLLPPKLRQERMIVWLYSLLSPLKWLHTQFLLFIDNITEKLNYNSQVICFEKILNDTFNSGQQGIYIIDGSSLDNIYIYNVIEAMPETYIYNQNEAEPASYLYNTYELSSQYDFIVMCPYPIYNTIDISHMQAFINYYKLASKTYIIQPY